jgi:hypothetical protein
VVGARGGLGGLVAHDTMVVDRCTEWTGRCRQEGVKREKEGFMSLLYY